MRVLLLANAEGSRDEGARNVSRAILDGLRQRHQVLCIPAPASVQHLGEIRRFRPHIVHSLHGPSPRTFAMLAALHIVVPRAAMVASLSQTGPGFAGMQLWLRGLRFIRLLSQDPSSEAYFSRLGFLVHPVPNGVDTERFRLTQPRLPGALQARLAPGRPVLMHLGHLKANRGLDILAQLSGYRGWQVLVVGSPALPPHPHIVQMLEAAGCIVLRDFVDDLPGLYSAVDLYAFPVSHWSGAIDMPLTVLEAMACNRPVLSTRFKALPRFLPEGDGLYYFESVLDAQTALDHVMDCREVATRQKVASLGWDNVISRLEEVYSTCLSA